MTRLSKRIAILGSTGSIGRSTLEVVAHHEEKFEIVGLAAGRGVRRLAEQVQRWRPRLVSVADETAARELRALLGGNAPPIRVGDDGAVEVAVGTGAEIVVAAVVGAAGLLPTLAAASAGLTVALANKEALVVAGELMVRASRESGARLLPVDSEHNAIHQCVRAGQAHELSEIILTASGGPFRGWSRDQLERVSVEQALAHPTWSMGPKITIDSATLMNKGLEVIEAAWLFGLGPRSIEVVIHPQSVVHSVVRFRDGSLIAQLGAADMRHPIQYALSYPHRWNSATDPLDLVRQSSLTFEAPDRRLFRCLDLAYMALAEGGTAPAVLNAADEIAVAAFLDGRIGFLDIPRVIESALEAEPVQPVDELADVLEADARARTQARGLIERELQRR
ncbi:MAG: 1-deoxy-D-xylulose-5-phosphate reductoisomerase [Acidobacteriota bacterium]|nr:MAG: 1-deoxy-D-xylulose-5-phosphate reductoisomerase [Acidobacteriota bacterium]